MDGREGGVGDGPAAAHRVGGHATAPPHRPTGTSGPPAAASAWPSLVKTAMAAPGS